MLTLLKDVKTTLGLGAVAAGTSDQDTTVIDMSGFDAARFVLSLGDVTASSVVELQIFGNTASSTSGATELTNDELLTTAGASDMDSKLVIADVVRPAYRYLFARVKRGSQNAVINSVIVDQYRARSLPVTQGSTVFDSATIGPAA